MKKTRYTQELIAYALRQAETGSPVGVVRKMGISTQMFYGWKKQHGQMGLEEIRRLKQLEEENRKLKQLVAALRLDKLCPLAEDRPPGRGAHPQIAHRRSKKANCSSATRLKQTEVAA